MSRLIWKELRENFKWALLALMVLAAAEIYGIYPHSAQEMYGGYDFLDGATLCKKSFLTATTFGCAAVGFVLGLIQILPELKRDRWAALLHRPMPRGVIFLGKAVAGLTLYLLAAVPPYLYVVWLVATPGHFGSPFVPEMVAPGVADIAMGAVYYFAALAVALLRGGWMLRALPILAAIHTSYFVLSVKPFYVALEAAVLIGLALFVAAWGEIHNPEGLRGRPWLGKAAFLGVAFYGVCGLGDLGQSLLNAFGSSGYSNFERWEFTHDGVPLHLTYGKGGVVAAVRDLNGNPVSDPQLQPDRVRNHLEPMNWFSEYIGDAHGYHAQRYEPAYRETRAYFWGDSPIISSRPEQWFMLVNENYLIGFLPQKKVPFGYLDPQGFLPLSATPHGFPSDMELRYAGSGRYCLWSPMSASFADMAEHKLVSVVLPAPAPIYGVGYAWGETKTGNTEVTGLSLGTGMATYDSDGALITFLPYHHDVSRWGWLELGVTGKLDRFYLVYQPSGYLPDKEKKAMPSFLDVMDAKGGVVQSYTLPALPDGPPRPRTWQRFGTDQLRSPVSYFGTILYKAVGAALGSDRMRGDIGAAFGKHWGETVERSLYTAGFSLMLAGAALAWARRDCVIWPRAWAWAGFVLAFGLPGFIAFRLAASWPRLVACAACAKQRPVDAPTCPHCGAGWPVPPRTGIEIFEPAEMLASASTAEGGRT
jgi:hypothetical protein